MSANTQSTTTATSMESPSADSHRSLNGQLVQNFHLVWLNESIDEINSDDYRNSITQLRRIVNTVTTFTNGDECVDFITDIKEGKTFMIVSGTSSQLIVPVVQDISQVSSVYIFCENKIKHEKWAQQWSKVKGVFTDIPSICEPLKQAVEHCDENSVAISFVKTTDEALNQNLDTLDPSFMYTQILKEILLTINFVQEHINEFLTYCREQFAGNTTELRNVDKIQKDYHDHQPIWWYTYQSFLYSMLNRALRLMDVELVIKMGFFIRDLHNNIVALHAEQYTGHHHLDSFIVYRGQGLSHKGFDHLKKTQGGLISFNTFLSTSRNRDVSLLFAKGNQYNLDLIGVLFEITIDPSISSSPFADITTGSYFHGAEEEILFSMHTVFRIGQVKQIDGIDRLWQVNLTLTSDNDPDLHALTERIREETRGSTGWVRLAHLMIKLGQFNKAEELYEILLQQTSNEDEQATIFNYLGRITEQQGKYAEAIPIYEKALEIYQKTLPTNHFNLATAYNNIGLVYDSMGEYSKALSCYEKALEIFQKNPLANHLSLATSYNNIGAVYDNMGEYSKALSYYEKALEIFQKTLPSNHPSLATSYNNIGRVYDNMGEHLKALSCLEKTLEIDQKTLPANHPELAVSYNNISLVYHNMEECSKALLYHEKALEIWMQTLPVGHSYLATSYNNIGLVYNDMGDRTKALSFCEKDLKICENTLSPKHPLLATSYNNIGFLYNNRKEHAKALSCHKRALQIRQATLPINHPDLAASYSHMGTMNCNMGDYSKALLFFKQSLEILQKTHSPNHRSLANSCIDIARVFDNMGEHSNALTYYEKALAIFENTLSQNHPDLAISYNNIAGVYNNMKEYAKALSYYEKALAVFEETLPANHPSLAASYNSIGGVYYHMRKYSEALSYYERAQDIWQHSLPSDHPNIKTVEGTIEYLKIFKTMLNK